MSYILTERRGLVGYITLNRPEVLNSLSHSMIGDIQSALDAHIADNDVDVIVINSTSQRAFCAGGDMKATRLQAIDQQWDELQAFFKEEYALNLAISLCPKPYVSFIDGIAMGGGLGLSVHGAVSIVSETARLAMPETAIGFFPDVGGTYFLSRAPNDAGLWLALTGQSVLGAQAVSVGLATHCVEKEKWPDIIDALEKHGRAALTEPLSGMTNNDVSGDFIETLELRRKWFSEPDLASLIQRLKTASGDFEDAAKLLNRVKSNSPFGMDLTRQCLSDAKEQENLEACLKLELIAADTAVRHPDFVEGIRAVLVDKNKALWQSEVPDV